MTNYITEKIGRRFYLYNTVCEVVLYTYKDNPHELLNECENISIKVEEMLNLYSPDSELSLMNKNYQVGIPYSVSKELYTLLKKMDDFARISQGAFDYTIGPLVHLWDFTSNNPKIPNDSDIHKALSKVGYDLIKYEDDCSLNFSASNMVIDAGGSGKGYAVGMVREYLLKKEVKSASINFGGNLCVIGKRELKTKEHQAWKIGIQKPWLKRGESLGYLILEDLSIATSGGYDRFFKKNEKLYQHILNPKTGYPIDSDLLSISIVCDVPIMTDLVSTAFFVLGINKGAELLKKLRENMYIEFIAVTENGIFASKGVESNFKSANDINIIS